MSIVSEELTDAQKQLHVRGNDRYALPAILRGSVYCAPWCGAHCTKAAYDRAVVDADALAARLGDGWSPRVSENMGWHYEATKGIVRVIPSTSGGTINADWTVDSYSAWINFPGHQFIQHADTPEDALGFAVQEARTFVARLNQVLVDLSEDTTP